MIHIWRIQACVQYFCVNAIFLWWTGWEKTLAQAGQVEEVEEVKAEVDTTKVGEWAELGLSKFLTCKVANL